MRKELDTAITKLRQAVSASEMDGTSPETVLDPRERWRFEVFLVIVDILIVGVTRCGN